MDEIRESGRIPSGWGYCTKKHAINYKLYSYIPPQDGGGGRKKSLKGTLLLNLLQPPHLRLRDTPNTILPHY